jgi:hypothetical protein
LLLPTLRKSLGVKDDSVRSEIMQLIGHAARTLPALVVRKQYPLLHIAAPTLHIVAPSLHVVRKL